MCFYAGVVRRQIILNSVTTRGMMTDILAKARNVKFVQSHFAGVEHLLVPELVNSDIQVSNAKGLYASPLAEFAIMGCTYFAKDLPRLLRQKADKRWEKYMVQELRGATMGIIGCVSMFAERMITKNDWVVLMDGMFVVPAMVGSARRAACLPKRTECVCSLRGAVLSCATATRWLMTCLAPIRLQR